MKNKIVEAEAAVAKFAPKDKATAEVFLFDMGENFVPQEIVVDFSKFEVKIIKGELEDENLDTRID